MFSLKLAFSYFSSSLWLFAFYNSMVLFLRSITIVQLTLLVLLRTDFFTITASLGCWLNVFLLLKSPHINWISFCIQWSVLRTIISYWSYHWVVSSAACTTGLSFQMRKNRTPFAHHLSYTGLLTYFTLITTEYGLLGFWWSRPSCLCGCRVCLFLWTG